MNRYFGLHTLEGEWHALLPRYMFMAESVQGARILDIGCGNGLGASLLLELGAGGVDAIDHRPAVLELARMKHAKEGLDFHVMLWEELDFPEDTFDIILCLDPSSPVTDPNLLREVRRVLRPGGQYVCAIERKNIQGIESLLPRYGYTDTAERVDINQSTTRVPQIGEISRHFRRVHTIIQRPQYSFAFDLAASTRAEPSTGRESRRLGQEEALHLGEVPELELPERWLKVERAFCTADSEDASVELWFCGDDALAPPSLHEIRIPYYSLVTRLRQMLNDLQSRQRAGHTSGQEVFDELLEAGDEQTESFEDAKQTGELPMPRFEEETTQVRARPLPAQAEHIRPTLQLEQLDAHLSELNSLHRRIKTDFDRLFFETSALFEDRDDAMKRSLAQLKPATTPPETQAYITSLEARVAQLEAQLALQAEPQAPLQASPHTPAPLEHATTKEFVRSELPLDPLDAPPEAAPEASEPVLEEISTLTPHEGAAEEELARPGEPTEDE